jgi:hypothetical protein
LAVASLDKKAELAEPNPSEWGGVGGGGRASASKPLPHFPL